MKKYVLILLLAIVELAWAQRSQAQKPEMVVGGLRDLVD